MAATIELERIGTHPEVYATTLNNGLRFSETLILAMQDLEGSEIDEMPPLGRDIPLEELDCIVETFEQPGLFEFETHGYYIRIVDWETMELTEKVRATPEDLYE